MKPDEKAQFTKQDVESMRHKAYEIRLIAVAVGLAVIAFVYILTHVRSSGQTIADHDEYDSIREIETVYVVLPEDSMPVKVATYSFDDVLEMVNAIRPSDSWASLWRGDNDNWIVLYSRQSRGKSRDYMCEFNPEDRTIEKEIPVKYRCITRGRFEGYDRIAYDRIYGEGSYIISTTNELRYDSNGRTLVKWSVEGVRKYRLSPVRQNPPLTGEERNNYYSDDLDGYEDCEDYYYDNEEDLYFYYGD